MLDLNECRGTRQAVYDAAQASQTTNPIIKERLTETAQGWLRLAADFEKYNDRTVDLPDRQKCTA